MGSPGRIQQMRDPGQLTRIEIDDLVRKIQHILWLEQNDDENGVVEFWDPNKEPDLQMIDGIAGHMRDLGLAPR